MADDRLHDIELIRRYLDGQLDARAMHELEYRAQQDPMLADMLQGMEQGSEQEHTANMQQIDQLLAERIRQEKRRKILPAWKWASVAACFLLVVGIGSFWMQQKERVPQLASQNEVLPPKVVLPPAAVEKTATDTAHIYTAPIHTETIIARQKAEHTHIPNLPAKAATQPAEIAAADGAMPEIKAKELNKSLKPARMIRGAQLPRRKTIYIVDNKQVSDSAFALLSPGDIKKMYVTTDTATRLRFGARENDDLLIVKTTDTISKTLSELVVTGYTTERKRDVTGSVSSIKAEDIEQAGGPPGAYSPAYPSVGWYNYSQFLKKNARLPTGETGVVKLRFTVAANGYISNIVVVKHLSDAADLKAIELLKNGPAWTGNKDGKPQTVRLRVRFRKE